VAPVQAAIEPDLVYPLLRGRDIRRWQANPSAHIILAQDPKTRTGISEHHMKIHLPLTYAYLKRFEGDPENPQRGTLRGRSGFRQYFRPTDPFYSMYNVGPYTMAKWKVVWREQSSFFQAAVVDSVEGRPILPDHKLMLVPCANGREAHYLCAMLNSAPSKLAILSYCITISTSTHVLENISVPKYLAKRSAHQRIALLSRRCHAAAAKGDYEAVAALEREIDAVAAKIWGITKEELRDIQDALAERGLGGSTSENDAEMDDE